jgi:DinB superfamily
MSVFSNPASRSIEQAKAYTAAVSDLLGARNPMEVLQETPLALRKALAGLSEGQMAEPEARGKWSVRHVVQHVADSELVWGYRLRKVLGEDRPPLTGYDQDLWAQRLRYDEANVENALDDFGILRRSNLRLLTGASGDDLKRVGVHAERGEESVGHMIGLYAGHDLLHLRQLDRIRQAVAQ